MSLTDLTALAQDICSIYYDFYDDYNVQIKIGENSEMEIFKAHSVILRARSLYFRESFSNNWVEREQDGSFTLTNNFDRDNRYIYTGTCDLKDCDTIIKLLIAADELAIDGLVKHIQNYIITNETALLLENLVKIFQISSKHEAFAELREVCGQQISRNPDLLLKSSDIAWVEKNSLLTFIKRDDINTDEINIWNSVVKWGMGQEPKLDEDIKNWTSDDFKELKNRVHDFFPYIRFFIISGRLYYEYIRPFKSILPKRLKEKLKKFYYFGSTDPPCEELPSRVLRYDPGSILIESTHLSLISSWIDHRDYNSKLDIIPYEFKLLIRGSRDGMKIQEFHDRCDNKKATLIVIKVADTGDIIGGYNPLPWASTHKWISTTESFIFSLGIDGKGIDGKGIGNSILSRVTNPDEAIFDGNSTSPNFGFGYDLWWFGGRGYRKDYEKSILLNSSFKTQDYEVFEVIKK
ncbi:2770_t:CDS:2 [Acaulospora colombiana]|uniref:2770_t:CDS:1 n=1 Tax=Acaulospora colombiana TaxID=27376 RepID=A0ACA9JXF2_9GLOM|nr:2770_t:CDS:2 [Acaulospora colombiana]